MKKEAAHYNNHNHYNHNRRSEFKTNYYVDGNTVRRLEGEPEERRRRKLEKERALRKRQKRKVARRNQERALHMSLGYVLFCTAALALACLACIAYIQLQADITNRTKSISRLESQVANLRADNDAEKKRIELSVDLNEIKQRALEAGMKYARKDQILYYSVQSDDFMNQYSDIPKK